MIKTVIHCVNGTYGLSTIIRHVKEEDWPSILKDFFYECYTKPRYSMRITSVGSYTARLVVWLSLRYEREDRHDSILDVWNIDLYPGEIDLPGAEMYVVEADRTDPDGYPLCRWVQGAHHR
jgi:hypothetical protein